MKKLLILCLSILVSIGLNSQDIVNGTNLFDFGWRFHLGGAQYAEQPGFNDSQWRRLDLPHDWSIEDMPGTQSPFNRDAISQCSGGFTTGGTGWYRKTFKVPSEQKGKSFILLFEGVYMNAEVWLNGQYLSNHPYGYTSFWYDISDKIQYSENNVLAIKVMNEGENSRWYSGSGIYRHVWLSISAPVHIATWGTYVVTPDVSTGKAKTNIQTSVTNKGDEPANVRLVTRLTDPKGKDAGSIESKQTIAGGETQTIKQGLDIKDPELWSIESPVLYQATSEIFIGSNLVDQKETTFGIRSISFDATNGFQLNGKTLKLKGGCVHHDNGPLGSKAYDRAEERRVELLKESGFNAIRCAHNPPSPAFLDACDRLGMLVIDEAFDMWMTGKNPLDYHLYFNDWWKKDIDNMIYRDRNHPSIIMWSIGNEIPDKEKPEVSAVAKMLGEYVRQIDPTRPVTSAVNDLKPDKDPYFATLDVAGYNYGKDNYVSDHERNPKRVMFATESFPLETFGYWMSVIDNPYVVGDFVWTAFDYIGEASIGWRGYMQEQNFYPWNLAFCGDIDICGWKRPQSYYRDALWKSNQLSVFVKPPQPSFQENPNRLPWSKWNWLDAVADWNWAGNEGTPLEVSVYSSCREVELFLNNKSLGRKKTDRSTEFRASWEVPYQAGVLKATGYIGNKEVNTATLYTAGEPTQIKLTADRAKIKADGQDLSYIMVELLDNKGVRNPKAEDLVKFKIEGPGTIVGIGNANPMSTESYQLPERKAWRGKCLVIIKSGLTPGKITLTVKSSSLTVAKIEILQME